jgi:hypothetical protein
MRRRLVVLLVVISACGAVPSLASASLNVDYKCNGSSQCEGVWFTSPVFLDWTVTGATSWSAGCVDETINADTTGIVKRCTAYNPPASYDVSLTIKLDQKPPSVSVTPERPADHAGWYTRPVTFSIGATDETSGLAGCDPLTYAGPDATTATITGTCRDRAGNTGTRSFILRYDATPPDPSPAAVKTGDRVVRLSWPVGATASLVRTPGTKGATSSVLYQGTGTGFTDREVRNGRRYRYVLTLTDEAGNSASQELLATPQRKLLTPLHRAIVAAPPLLTWTPVRGARYYNVQLLRKGRKILSAWPKLASLQLKQTWRYHGRRYRLKPGKYSWYVWPGKGPRSARRYGERIGPRTFVVQPGA